MTQVSPNGVVPLLSTVYPATVQKATGTKMPCESLCSAATPPRKNFCAIIHAGGPQLCARPRPAMARRPAPQPAGIPPGEPLPMRKRRQCRSQFCAPNLNILGGRSNRRSPTKSPAKWASCQASECCPSPQRENLFPGESRSELPASTPGPHYWTLQDRRFYARKGGWLWRSSRPICRQCAGLVVARASNINLAPCNRPLGTYFIPIAPGFRTVCEQEHFECLQPSLTQPGP